MTKYLNISTDNTLGGNSPSNEIVVSQKAIKEYVDSQSGSSSYHPDLFDWKWADHELDDMSWLRADTFSWQDGTTVYSNAYNHLLNDYQNNTIDFYGWTITTPSTLTVYTASETPKVGDWVYILNNGKMEAADRVIAVGSGNITADTLGTADRDSTADTTVADNALLETIAGTTITYYLAPDGHKICLPDQENNIEALFAATGVAWYYILDTDNTQFKLPRTQHSFVGYRDTVGNYVAPGLPNITGSITRVVTTDGNTTTGAFSLSGSAGTIPGYNSGTPQRRIASFDASRSSAIYGNGTTVQAPATQTYLYFYVGQFSQSAIEQTAGLNAELFNGKVDIGHEVIAFQEPTAANNYTWYRKYRDGWVEQGGYVASNGTADQHIALPIEMNSNTYYVATKSKSSATARPNDGASANHNTVFFYNKIIYNQTTTGFNIGSVTEMSIVGTYWQVKGMAA